MFTGVFVCVCRVEICFYKRLFWKQYWVASKKLILWSVRINWVMIQSTDGGWLWLTLHPVTDLASEQTLFPPRPLVKHRKQHCASSTSGHLFFPRPHRLKVKQLVRTRRPGSWMESCLCLTHTGAPLFSLLSFLSFSLTSSSLLHTLLLLQIYIGTHAWDITSGSPSSNTLS